MRNNNIAQIQKYYIPFLPMAKVDYRFLIILYDIAEYNKTTKCYDTIHYKSIQQLADILKKSRSALNTILNNKEYNTFFTVDKRMKRIIIHNNIVNRKTPFICLNRDETNFLITMNDNLLCKYYIYLKYYCGYTKSKRIDSTAKQILFALGYSQKSSYIDKLSEYNTILKANKLISIETYIDKKGHKRNIYSIS